MIVNLHNTMEITCGGKSYKFNNTVLGGINTKFLSGVNFTDYIVFGTGKHTDLTGVTSLNTFCGGKISSVYGSNFDINRGTIYLKKCIEIGKEEFNGVSIKEAGLSSIGNGTNLTNYVAIDDGGGNGILKKAGETLIIIATVYLTVTEDVKGVFCGGENPLFKLLLGLKNAAICKTESVFSDGIYSHKGILRKDFKVEKVFTATVSIEDSMLKICTVLPADSDYTEMLLTIDGEPALCFTAYNFHNTVVSENIIQNFYYGTAEAEAKGLKSVDSVRVGTYSYAFTSKNAPCGVLDCIVNPFSIVVKDNDRVFSSYSGDYMALYGGDVLNVYDISGGFLNKLSFLFMDFSVTDVANVLIDSLGNVYVNLKAYPYMSIYKNENGVLKELTPSRLFDSGIISVGLSEYGGNRYIYYVVKSGNTKKYYCYQTAMDDSGYTETLIKSCEGNLRHFFSKDSDSEIICDKTLNTATVYPSTLIVAASVKELLFDCDEAFINGGLIFIKKGFKWNIYDIVTGENLPIYESGVRKVFLSPCGTIIKLYSSNKLCGIYADGKSKKLYPFSIDKKISGAVSHVYVNFKCVIITAKTRFFDCYYLPFNFNKRIVYCNTIKNLSQVEGKISTTRKSFKKFASKILTIKLKLSEAV